MPLTHQVQQITELDARIRPRHHQFLTAFEAGADHIRLVETRDLAEHQAMHIGVAHRNIDGLQALLGLACMLFEQVGFFVDFDAKKQTNQPHGQQDATDAERIGNGIAHAHQAGRAGVGPQLGQDLLTRTEGGSVGHGAGEDPEDHWQGYIEQLMQPCRDHTAKDHQQGGESVQLEAGAAQGGEEAGTDLDADGVDKQDETELLNEVQGLLIERQIRHSREVAHYDATEQHTSYSQANAIDPPVSQPEPQHRHQRQHADGKRDITHRVHPF